MGDINSPTCMIGFLFCNWSRVVACQEFDITCECGTKFKSEMTAIHKASDAFHRTKVSCPKCDSTDSVKSFHRVEFPNTEK